MALYSWGANSHGQLGLRFENELVVAPEQLFKLPFNPNSIVSIKGGGGHVMILDQCGQLYSCGWNNRGQLGVNSIEDQNEFKHIPSEYFNDSAVEKFSCGWDISGAITTEKKLYIWGSNSFQQLGICQRGFSISTRPLRLILPRNEIAKKVSFGLRHCAVLTEDNKIYVFGRLKTENVDTNHDLTINRIHFNKTEILKIQSNFTIDSILSGQNHLIVLLENRTRVIGIGDNRFGQSNAFKFDKQIQMASIGWTHNGIIKEQNLFLWGRNTYGQIGCKSGGGIPGIGMNTLKDFFPTPKQLELENHCVPNKLYLGSEHALMLSKQGKCYTWGWNEHGNCGNGTTDNLFSPTLIELPGICKLGGTGAGFCYAVCAITDDEHKPKSIA